MTRYELWAARPEALVRFAAWLGVSWRYSTTREQLVNDVLARCQWRNQSSQ